MGDGERRRPWVLLAVFAVVVAVWGWTFLYTDDDRDTRVERVPVTFADDGPPAVENPTAEDRAWAEEGFEVLEPSRTDGKPTFSNQWFQWADTWRPALQSFVGRPDVRYLEVGVYEGQSMLWMFEHVLTDPSATAVGIDLFAHEGLKARFVENLERANLADRVTTIEGLSNVRLRELDEPFDIIYIDASHTGYDVLRDTVLSWDLLRPGGVLVFDDYGYTPLYPDELKPRPSIDAFITAFRDELRIQHRDYQLIVQRVEDPCPGVATKLGPYCYHWIERALVDPRTQARVPMTREELELTESVLRSRPPGQLGFEVDETIAEGEPLAALRRKLHI